MTGPALALAWLAVVLQGDPAPVLQRVAAQDVVCVPGEEACVVALEDGRLLRVDLDTGEVEASGAWSHHWSTKLIRDPARDRDGFRVASSYLGAQIELHAWEDLRGLAVARANEDGRVLAAAFQTEPESALAWAARLPGKPRKPVGGPLWIERPGREPLELGPYTGGVLSAAGHHLAVHAPDEVLLFDTETWEPVQRLATRNAEHLVHLEAEYELEPGDTMIWTWDLAFHGPDRLLVGWYALGEDAEFAGFDVFTLADEPRLAAEVRVPVFFASGIQLRSDADLGRVTTSLGQSGYVHVFRDDDWAPIWSVNYGGGNPSGMRLRRGGHPRWLGVSGMMPHNARLVDLVTGGEVVPKGLLEGCFKLSPSDSGRSLVAIRGGALTVLDVETQAVRFTRRDGIGGGSELIQGPAYE